MIVEVFAAKRHGVAALTHLGELTGVYKLLVYFLEDSQLAHRFAQQQSAAVGTYVTAVEVRFYLATSTGLKNPWIESYNLSSLSSCVYLV